jgi:hypothetical protein
MVTGVSVENSTSIFRLEVNQLGNGSQFSGKFMSVKPVGKTGSVHTDLSVQQNSSKMHKLGTYSGV